jgi:hypothetical protein
MIRALSLLWTLMLAAVITAISFFYVRDEVKHGFPFTFARDSFNSDGTVGYNVNYFSVALDMLVWWVLFSLVWVIVKNYVLEVD